MTPIQTNLAALGLPPLPQEVQTFFLVWEGADTPCRIDTGTYNLEELLTDHNARWGLQDKARAQAGGAHVPYVVQVEGPDGFKAEVSSDGDLALKETDLRATYLVRVISEWGKDHVLDPAALRTDEAVAWMKKFVLEWYEEHPLHYDKDGNVQEYHDSEGRTANRFMYALTERGDDIPGEVGFKDFFRYQKESQFADGYCGAVGDMWRAACWELFGEEREYPYRFCY